jgi:hypothetical protein
MDRHQPGHPWRCRGGPGLPLWHPEGSFLPEEEKKRHLLILLGINPFRAFPLPNSTPFFLLHQRQGISRPPFNKGVQSPGGLLHFFFSFELGFELRTSHLQTGIPPLEPYLQLIFLWLFWRWGPVNYLSRLTSSYDPPHVSLTGMNHWHLADLPHF